MTDCNHSSIVVFSLKIAVKQAGDHPRMPPKQAGVVIKTPASAYSVGMHHENASLHPRVPERFSPFAAGFISRENQKGSTTHVASAGEVYRKLQTKNFPTCPLRERARESEFGYAAEARFLHPALLAQMPRFATQSLTKHHRM
jgi:hypothetical protein